ncbi:hypothetical protein BSKO_12183 [Bryopsis sp. KO-2023]|nr:hypothetical protein BSKO_12183 [Bryopsis sp. KO-2023]
MARKPSSNTTGNRSKVSNPSWMVKLRRSAGPTTWLRASTPVPAVNAEKYPLSRESVCGIRQKTRIPKENNFAQPGELYRSWNSERRERFAMRIVDNFLLQPRVTPELQRIWIDFWSQADEELGAKLMEKVNAIAGGETVVLSSP